MTPMQASADNPVARHYTTRRLENSPFRRGDHGIGRDVQRDHHVLHRREEPVRKQRSLSPYSKRIALTQAMNVER